MTMLTKLENYYRECGILSTDFRCECRATCQSGLPLTPPNAERENVAQWWNTFTEARSAYVGDRYGEVVPRLLFVSLDPRSALKSDDPDYNFVAPETRTPLGVRVGMERVMGLLSDGIDSSRRPRLGGTNALAERILQEFPTALKGGHVMRVYAHTNAAKCCMNKEGGKEADRILFKNCRSYLRGEINILSPDIIVTQGGKAKRAVAHAFRGDAIKEVCIRAWTIECDERKMFWWHTYHPSSFGRPKFLRQMAGEDGGPGRDGYAKLIRDFISDRDS